MPIEATLKFTRGGQKLKVSHTLSESNNTSVNWVKLKVEEINIINERVDTLLRDFRALPVHDCHRLGCRDSSHLSMIDGLYSLITTSLHSATRDYTQAKIKSNKFKVIPGWNRCVKAKHNIAREKFLQWVMSLL